MGGIDAILPYIKDYVKTYIGHSINYTVSTQWKDHLYSFANQEDKIEACQGLRLGRECFGYCTYIAQAWFYGEGATLPVKLEYDLALVTAAYDLADRWNASRDVDDLSKLDPRPSELNSNQRGDLLCDSLLFW